MKINKVECLGCGACVSTYPELFELKEGKSSLKNVKYVDRRKFDRCKYYCPVGAII